MNVADYKEFLKSEFSKLNNLNPDLPVYMFKDSNLNNDKILEVESIFLNCLKSKKSCAYLVEDQKTLSRWTVLDLRHLNKELENDSLRIVDKIEIVFVPYLG